MIFVEVKSSAAQAKDFFLMSHPELKFAEEQKEKYHVCRVSGAGGPSPSLVRVVDPIAKWIAKQISVCLLL